MFTPQQEVLSFEPLFPQLHRKVEQLKELQRRALPPQLIRKSLFFTGTLVCLCLLYIRQLNHNSRFKQQFRQNGKDFSVYRHLS